MAPAPQQCLEGESWRNFACPHYSRCLDQAAQAWWTGFTCRGCALKAEVRPDWCDALRADQEGLGTLAATILCQDDQGLRFRLLRG
jgi:hypothetical protein